MTDADVEDSARVQWAAFADLDRREGATTPELTDAILARQHGRFHHFLANDPDGSWVAVDDGAIIGCALALTRDSLWGLSLLVVDPASQSTGAGRALLDASLRTAAGCDRAVIVSTTDARAMRAYATSGFALYPQVRASGPPDPAAVPALHGRVRDGSPADVGLADEIDRVVRGAARGPDQVRMATDMPVFIVDDVDGRGYAYVRSDGELYTMAATDDDTATALLWRALAHIAELEKPATVEHLNAVQQWAIRVSYLARLTVAPAGPVFWRGITPPPAYLPSGAYL
jgi:GNAT superfamily N-acetyltransferase